MGSGSEEWPARPISLSFLTCSPADVIHVLDLFSCLLRLYLNSNVFNSFLGVVCNMHYGEYNCRESYNCCKRQLLINV